MSNRSDNMGQWANMMSLLGKNEYQFFEQATKGLNTQLKREIIPHFRNRQRGLEVIQKGLRSIEAAYEAIPKLIKSGDKNKLRTAEAQVSLINREKENIEKALADYEAIMQDNVDMYKILIRAFRNFYSESEKRRKNSEAWQRHFNLRTNFLVKYINSVNIILKKLETLMDEVSADNIEDSYKTLLEIQKGYKNLDSEALPGPEGPVRASKKAIKRKSI